MSYCCAKEEESNINKPWKPNKKREYTHMYTQKNKKGKTYVYIYSLKKVYNSYTRYNLKTIS